MALIAWFKNKYQTRKAKIKHDQLRLALENLKRLEINDEFKALLTYEILKEINLIKKKIVS